MQITRHLLILPLILTVAACSPPTIVSPPPTKSTETPILQIDPGGNKALIRDILFTPDGRYLVSAGDDKLIRVWDINSGKTVRTLRGQIGAGREGKIFAMALSPNGQWLAVGGSFTGTVEEKKAIRLYNFASGQLIALLKGHTNVVFSLAFSPDNRFLMSGSADRSAIIWDIERQQQLHILRGHTEPIYAVAFTPDAKRVVTGSYDHNLRLWRVSDGEQIATLTGHTDKVYAVAISPRDGTIASGSHDYTIRLWDGQTGQPIKTLANQSTRIGSLSFSPDGRYLVSGVGSEPPEPTHCYILSMPNGKKIVTYRGHDNVVRATAVSPDGRVVATGGGANHEIHLWSLHDGHTKQRLRGVGASTWAVGFSADGQAIAWGKTSGPQSANQRGPLEYTLTLPTADRSLTHPQPLSSGESNFIRAQGQWRNSTLRHRAGGNYGYQDTILDIREQNRTVASIERSATDGYRHQSYTFTPDGQQIISGGSHGVLTAYNRNGHKLGDYVGHTGDVLAVAVSPDGRLLLSGSDDQTVRLWNVATRKNLLTLFHGSNGEWVAWTTSGHYTASPNGDNMVGWQINRGVTNAADYVKAKQLREHLYRPDVVDAAIRLRSVDKAVAQTEAHFNLARLQRELPPRFEIVSPQGGHKAEQGVVPVVLSIAENALEIQSFAVDVNGRQVTPETVRKINPIYKRHQRTVEVPLGTGDNRITIEAKNSLGILSGEVTVHYDGPSQIGTLHLVSIGVSAYPHLPRSKQLNFAAIDAQALHNTLATQAKKQYRDIKRTLLSDNYGQSPTKSNIEAALQNMPPAKPADTTILFLSGHGVNIGKDYYFVPRDARLRGDNKLDPNTLVPWQVLQQAITQSQGRRILLIDTCHAGNAFNPRLLQDAGNQKLVVLSATNANSVSIEKKDLGHGVFTQALLEGIKGKAALFGGGKITFKALDLYISNRVAELTQNRQKTVSQASYQGFEDFVFLQLE